MTVRPIQNKFMADFMVGGVRYRERFPTWEDAEKYEQDTRHALKYGKPVPVPQNGMSPSGGSLDTLGKLRDYTVRHVWERARGSTSQITYSKQVVDFLGASTPVSGVTKFHMQQLADHFLDQGNSLATVNRKLAALSRMLTEAVEHGVIDKKPRAPMAKEMAHQIRFLTPDEEERLLLAFDHLGLMHWHRFTQVAIDTGMRLGELMRLRWEHLGPNGTIHIWQTKNNKPRTIFATDRVTTILQSLQDRCGGPFVDFEARGKLKKNYRDQWYLACEVSKVDKRIHDLRHTCASRMVQRGVDLMRVKAWLGHTRVETTLRYAHLAPNDLQQCRRALEETQPSR